MTSKRPHERLYMFTLARLLLGILLENSFPARRKESSSSKSEERVMFTAIGLIKNQDLGLSWTCAPIPVRL